MSRSGLFAVGAVLAALCGCTAPPAAPPDRPGPVPTAVSHPDQPDRADPSALDRAGLARGIETVLGGSRTGRFDQVRAIVVEVGRQRHYVRGDPAARGDVRSVTTTVLATLVGIAIHEGHLRGIDQQLGELLPSYVDVMPERLRSATLRAVLTMTAGTAPDRTAGVTPPTPEQDWVSYALAREPRPRPTIRFAHSAVGAHLLSAVLAEAIDRPVLDYAREKLFEPLGIGTGPGLRWAADPQGRPFGGYGLEMSADDMVALGRLYLDGGRRDEQQIVPAGWVDEATRPQVSTRDTLPAFGYEWWITGADGHRAFVAAGFGGQLIEVVPDLDLVVAVASDVGPVPGASAEEFAELVDRVIAPAVP